MSAVYYLSTSESQTLTSAPYRTSALDQLVWAGRAISVKEPLNSNYISIWLRGFLAVQCSAASALW
jgi:hypothetical protein